MTVAKRNLLFDIARAIAIYLVIIGHSMTGLWGTWQSNLIFAANLPIFFVISGYFYHPKKIKDVIKTGTNTLLTPFFIIIIFYTILRAIISLLVKHKHYLNFQTLMPIIYGNGATAHSPFGFALTAHVGAIWFLLTMFIANIIFYLLMTVNKEYLRFIIVSLLFLLGCLLANFGYFPWSLQTALEVQIYYLFGHWLSIITKHWSENTIFSNPLIFIVGAALWLISSFSGTYELNRGLADNMLAAVLGGFGSSIVILSIALLIEKHWTHLAKILSYVGRYSLVILGVHSVDISLLDAELMHFLQAHDWFITYSLLIYLGLMFARIIYTTVFSWLILKVPFIYRLLVDRYFPLKIKQVPTK